MYITQDDEMTVEGAAFDPPTVPTVLQIERTHL